VGVDVEHTLDALAQPEAARFQIELARFHAREIQDVVDEHQQRIAAARDRAQVILLHAVEIGLRQEIGESQHAIERRANLVAHHREELALGSVGRFRGLLRRHQSALRLLARGHVRKHAAESRDAAIDIPAGAAGAFHGADFPGLAADAEGDFRKINFARDLERAGLTNLRRILRDDELIAPHADRLGQRVARDRLPRRVQEDPAALGVGLVNDLLEIVDEVAVAGLAHRQFGLRALDRAQIVPHDEHHLPAIEIDEGIAHLDGNQLARDVLLHHLEAMGLAVGRHLDHLAGVVRGRAAIGLEFGPEFLERLADDLGFVAAAQRLDRRAVAIDHPVLVHEHVRVRAFLEDDLESLLAAAALADVEHYAVHRDRLAVGAEGNDPAVRHPEIGPIRFAKSVLDAENAAPLFGAVEGGHHARTVIGMGVGHPLPGIAVHLARPPAQEPREIPGIRQLVSDHVVVVNDLAERLDEALLGDLGRLARRQRGGPLDLRSQRIPAQAPDGRAHGQRGECGNHQAKRRGKADLVDPRRDRGHIEIDSQRPNRPTLRIKDRDERGEEYPEVVPNRRPGHVRPSLPHRGGLDPILLGRLGLVGIHHGRRLHRTNESQLLRGIGRIEHEVECARLFPKRVHVGELRHALVNGHQRLEQLPVER